LAQTWHSTRNRPKTKKSKASAPLVAEVTSPEFSLVTSEERDAMPASIRELHEQHDLMAVTDSELAGLPIAKWGSMSKLRIGRLAHRAVQGLELPVPGGMMLFDDMGWTIAGSGIARPRGTIDAGNRDLSLNNQRHPHV
jgi:hypothetical protein